MSGREERGQATAELALVLPVVALLLLLMAQVGLVVRDQLLVTHAAREAAREAAVDPSPDAARRAALSGAPLQRERLDLQLSRPRRAGARVEVRLRYRSPTAAPLVGPLLPDLVLTGRASMRAEV